MDRRGAVRRVFGAVAVLVALLLAVSGVVPVLGPTPAASAQEDPPTSAALRITEWMYDGAGGEWVELTNVGDEPVDLAGWRYDDDSASYASGFDLSGFGVVEPGESVVFTESQAEAFRTDWGLCAEVKLLGGYTNNLGRADQITVFDASQAVVDRLAYGDQAFPGTIRTTGASGWVSADGVGADDPHHWTLSTVGDAEGSVASTGGAIGSPGRSTRATVDFDPCAPPTPTGPTTGTVAVGSRFACALDPEGAAWCWGTDGSGTLGNGAVAGNMASPYPVDATGLPAGTAFTSVVAGATHACALTTTGDAWCWGADNYGQLGNGEAVTGTQASPTAVDVSGLPAGTTWAQLFAADYGTCGLTAAGDARCWGRTSNGVLGAGLTGNQLVPAAFDSSALAPGEGWATLDPTGSFGCGLTTTGRVLCWGQNNDGQLGIGVTDSGARPATPLDTSLLPEGTSFTQVDAGGSHACALTTAGQALCWGQDVNGQLGNGPTLGVRNRPEPVVAAGLPAGTAVDRVDANINSTCALLTDGSAWCWGFGSWGALGDGTAQSRNTPHPVDVTRLPAGTTFVDLSSYDNQVCARTADGRFACWGRDDQGQQGNGPDLNADPAPYATLVSAFVPVVGLPPTITANPTSVLGAVGDPTNQQVTLTLGDPDTDVADLVVTASTGDPAVITTEGVTIEGTGAERVASFAPVARGTTNVSFTAEDPEGNSQSVVVGLNASAAIPDPSGRYHHDISDASSALDIGDGYMLMINDETNTLFLYHQDRSGPPVKTWSFSSSELGTGAEIDFEAMARSGDTVVVSASHGNDRGGGVEVDRRHLVAFTIAGSGASTELTFAGRYSNLWNDLRTWDQADGHGLGADALGFAAGQAGGVQPNAPDGFNIEGIELSPSGTTGYLGFRAPTVAVEGEELERALIVPVTNLLALPTGTPGTTAPTFGEPILLDLDGRSIRDLRRNEHGEYLIIAGPSPSNPVWALYTWDGDPAHDAHRNLDLPAEDWSTTGAWESIVSVPHPLVAGAQVRLVTDSGDADLPNKSYSQLFTLAEPGVDPEPVSGVKITEFMYDGAGGEWVELTNVGTEPVDLAGWRYGDSSVAFEAGFDLSGFGVVEPGESVVLTDATAGAFRAAWGLCATTKVVGGSTPGLGRGDQINIWDSAGTLADRLTYGDQAFPGTIRTTNASGWVSAAGLGADDIHQWVLAAVGDAEGSLQSPGGPIGSPGRSTRATAAFDPCAGEIRITEWMYDGAGGEWIELTNVGAAPVDLTGWRYDDDSASYAEGFDLSGFGIVEPGESVVLAESPADAFRADWDLCAAIDVLGGYTNNLGRADTINVFDASQAVVDRLAYGDQAFPGTIRTSGASGWVSAAGLGADDPHHWALSTVGDAEGSVASTGGAVGSPGRSTRAAIERDACALPPVGGTIRITEWMYDGAGGEWVELTNVGDEPVDLAGWRYDDDSASYAEGFDLSGFGIVEPGESVVFTESPADVFRADWDLCAAIDVLGGYTNNLGRADTINVFDASQAVVDRLAYGDQAFPGTIRTSGASGWVSAEGLGADDPHHWTLSTVGDAEGSWTSTGEAIGSPGRSTRAIVGFDPCAGQIRITEWMYNGDSGEWIELTNVGEGPVDLTGWRYDDDSASYDEGFDLSGFGTVQPGESVVLTEDTAAEFRTNWDLCADAKVLGGYTNNLGRGDQINVFGADRALVDTLRYGDEVFPGTIRTDGAGGWVSAEGLGADDPHHWTLSTVGDAEGSRAAASGDVGSPGRSSRAVVAFDPCAPTGGQPTIEVDRPVVIGAVGDPTNPTATLTVGDGETPAADLVVTVQTSNGGVLPAAAVTVTGEGAERTVAFAPTGRGTATVTLTVADGDGGTDSVVVQYAASAQAPDATGRYFHGISDASSALAVGDGYVLLANDETNTIFLHREGVSAGPVKTWTFSPAQLGTSDEIDLEGVARSGDTLVWVASHGNNREGEVRTERRTMFATTITGAGASTELSFAGRYDSLWQQLRTWDQVDGHGLGADALGFVAGSAPGVEPNAPDGFNVEAVEFAPDGTTGYLGLRAPTVAVEGEERAVIVPVTNLLALPTGSPGTTPATFGQPVLVDLDGRSIRELRRNEHGDYLISAGPSPSNGTWALYTWDGDADHQPAFNRELPAEDVLTGGVWESIASVPHPLVGGAAVTLVTDSGDTNFYGTGATKDLPAAYQKSYAQAVTLGEVPGGAEGDFILTLLHNNDGESKVLPNGTVGGAARFKSLVDQLKATAAAEVLPEGTTGKGTVMISSGDNFLAGPNFAASQALPEGTPYYDAALIDLVGYDAVIIGNHELDFGPETLARFIGGTTDVPFLSANLDVSDVASLEALRAAGRIAPWTVVTKDGEQIGIIGATTEGLASISSPGDVVVDQVLPAVQAAVAALEGMGVDKVILASHLQDINNELALVAQLRGVDIVISGGGDELLGNAATDPLVPGETPVADYPRIVDDADGTDVPVITTAGDYKYVGRLKVRFDAEGQLAQVYEPESQPIRVSGADGDPVAVAPDPVVQAQVEAPVAAYVSGLAANVIGHTEVPLDGRNPQPIRRSESNLGNLAADALLWQADVLAAGAGAPVPDVALQNGGGIRNNSVIGLDATPGAPQPLTELDTFNVFPFSNFVSVVPDVTPAQLKALLEHSVAGVPSGGGPTGGGQWGHWAGLRFSWTSAGTAQVIDVPTNSVATPGTRVIDVVLADGTVLFDDGALAPTARDVNLATIDFTARGGDNYPFAGTSLINVGASYQQALLGYLTSSQGLAGQVSAERYPALGQVVGLGDPNVEENAGHRRNVEAAGFPVYAPEVGLSAAGLEFPGQRVGTTSEAQVVVVANTGNAPLAISGVGATGPFSVTATACTGAPLAPGATCELAVTFGPTAVGTADGTLAIASDAAGSPHAVALVGVGRPALASVPGAPTGATATGGVLEATVSWVAPASDGGAPLTGYLVTASPGGATTVVGAGTTSVVLGDLAPGSYTFTVRATNSAGTGPASASTAAVAVTDGSPVVEFPDVPGDHPFFEDVAWLVGAGITTGTADGTFQPAAAVTRGSMATFLYRMAGSPATPGCEVAPFPDVSAEHAFCEEIAWLVGEGITTGFADGTFRPGEVVTRGSMAAFLYRAAGSPLGADPACTAAAFPDVPAGHPFCGEVAWLVSTGVTTGFGDGTFRPADPVTRGSMAAFLHRMAGEG